MAKMRSNTELNPFALLCEFDGDVEHIRHVMYNCSTSRAGIEGKINEENWEAQTDWKLRVFARDFCNLHGNREF